MMSALGVVFGFVIMSKILRSKAVGFCKGITVDTFEMLKEILSSKLDGMDSENISEINRAMDRILK